MNDRLYRSRDDRMIAVVAGGLAGRPTREQWRAERRAPRAARERGPGSASVVIGAVLILTGAWFLLRELVPALEPSRSWPVALVGLGIVLLLVALGRRSNGPGGAPR
jgi:hypothetical protein